MIHKLPRAAKLPNVAGNLNAEDFLDRHHHFDGIKTVYLPWLHHLAPVHFFASNSFARLNSGRVELPPSQVFTSSA